MKNTANIYYFPHIVKYIAVYLGFLANITEFWQT